MKKRIISMLLAVVMLSGIIPISMLSSTAGTTESDASLPEGAEWIKDPATGGNTTAWWLIKDKVLTIGGEGPTPNYVLGSKLPNYYKKAPWNGKDADTLIIENGVTAIGDYAFYFNMKFKDVIIQGDLDKIGEQAFGICSYLVTVAAGDIGSIGENAFGACGDLSTVTMGDVGSIGENAFSGCALSNSATFTMGKVGSIGYGAFSACMYLNTFALQDLNSIDEDAFNSALADPNAKIYVPAEQYEKIKGLFADYDKAYGGELADKVTGTYWIRTETCEGGKIIADKRYMASGESVDLTVVTDEGYKFVSLSYKPLYKTGEEVPCTVDEKGACKLNADDLAMSISVTAKFEEVKTFDILNGTPESEKDKNHGYVVVPEKAEPGEEIEIKVVPNDKYKIKRVTYEKLPYATVTFDLSGVAGKAPKAQIVLENGKVTKPADPVAPDGVDLKFKGWYSVSALFPWDFETFTVSEDITLHAYWETTAEYVVSLIPDAPTKANPWVNEINDIVMYVEEPDSICAFTINNKEATLDGVGMLDKEPLYWDGEKYELDAPGFGKITFPVKDGVITSCIFEGAKGTDLVKYDGTYTPMNVGLLLGTVADGFPTGSSQKAAEITGAWNVSGTDAYLAVSTDYNKLLFQNGDNAAMLSLTQKVTPDGDDWKYVDNAKTFTFKMKDGVLTSVSLTGAAVVDSKSINGEYAPKKTGFAVTFDLNGVAGNAPTAQTVENGGKVTKPADPTDTVHTFFGWFKEAACIHKWDFDTDTVSEATTLYAGWQRSVASILGTFPSTDNTKNPPIGAWVGESGAAAYTDTNAECLTVNKKGESGYQDDTTLDLALDHLCVKVGTAYKSYFYDGDTLMTDGYGAPLVPFTFDMKDGALDSITVAATDGLDFSSDYAGVYKAPVTKTIGDIIPTGFPVQPAEDIYVTIPENAWKNGDISCFDCAAEDINGLAFWSESDYFLNFFDRDTVLLQMPDGNFGWEDPHFGKMIFVMAGDSFAAIIYTGLEAENPLNGTYLGGMTVRDVLNTYPGFPEASGSVWTAEGDDSKKAYRDDTNLCLAGGESTLTVGLDEPVEVIDGNLFGVICEDAYIKFIMKNGKLESLDYNDTMNDQYSGTYSAPALLSTAARPKSAAKLTSEQPKSYGDSLLDGLSPEIHGPIVVLAPPVPADGTTTDDTFVLPDVGVSTDACEPEEAGTTAVDAAEGSTFTLVMPDCPIRIKAEFELAEHDWNEWKTLGEGFGEWVFGAVSSLKGRISKCEVSVRTDKNNEKVKQVKVGGYGALVLTEKGTDLIIDWNEETNKVTIAPQSTDCYQPSYSENLMICDFNTFVGANVFASYYDPDTCTFYIPVIYYISLGNFGYNYEALRLVPEGTLPYDTPDKNFSAEYTDDDISVSFSDLGLGVVEGIDQNRQLLALCFVLEEGADEIPAGEYAIAPGMKQGTVLASSGILGNSVSLSFGAVMNEAGQLLVPMWFVTSGKVTVAYEGNVMNITVAGKNSYGRTVSAIYEKTMPPKYSITDDTTDANGKVLTNKETAAEGMTVTLTVAANDGYKYKADSLKATYNDGEEKELTLTPDPKQSNRFTFTMPGYAVSVKAEFEETDDTFKAVWDPKTKVLSFYYDDKSHASASVNVYDGLPSEAKKPEDWQYDSIKGLVKSVVIDESVKKYTALKSTAFMFDNMTFAESITGAEYLLTDSVTNMSHMFANFGDTSENLTVVPNVAGWNTENVTDMDNLFSGYGFGSEKLTEVPDVSLWKTGKVTDMTNMFAYYGYSSPILEKVPDVEKWNTAKVTSVNSMFAGYGNSSLTLNKTPATGLWNTESLENAGSMFQYYGYSSTKLTAMPDIALWNTKKLKDFSGMFAVYGCTSEILRFDMDLSGWDLSNVTNAMTAFGSSAVKAAHWEVRIPYKTGALTNTADTWYGSAETVYAVPAGGKKFMLTYPVTVEDGIQNGKVEAKTAFAPAGEIVGLEITPDENYRLKSLKAIYNDGTGDKELSITAFKGVVFTMPAYPVTVKAEFEKIPHGLTVTKENGDPAVEGKASAHENADYFWEKADDDRYRLYILKDGLVVSGTALTVEDGGYDEYLFVGKNGDDEVKKYEVTKVTFKDLVSYEEIFMSGNLATETTLVLSGTNQIGKAVTYEAGVTAKGDYSTDFGLGYCLKTLTVTGSGSLTIYDSVAGIDGFGDLIFDKDFTGTLTIEDMGWYEEPQPQPECAIRLGTEDKKYDLTIENGNFAITSYESDGIFANSITVNGGIVTVKGGKQALGVTPTAGKLIRVLASTDFAGSATVEFASKDLATYHYVKFDAHQHTDTDPVDHKCDICQKVISEHTDENKDHFCDLCKAQISYHVDADKDHNCDICGETLSEHTDENKDHRCDYCFVTISECADKDGDHRCDICKRVLSECADENKDHKCDVCGKKLSDHADENKDHLCDICGETLSGHTDANKDHKCDYCGKDVTECADANKDHKCDTCGKTLSECADENKDHKCDTCGKTLSECADANKDHKCDTCGKKISEHADANKDHKCDTCGEKISEHADANKDHVCDTCGEKVSEHKGVLVPGVEATADKAGSLCYYKCDCGRCFEDANCTVEIKDIDAWSSEGGKGYIPKKSDDPTPVAGDKGIILWAALLALSACGLCAALPKSRKKRTF